MHVIRLVEVRLTNPVLVPQQILSRLTEAWEVLLFPILSSAIATLTLGIRDVLNSLDLLEDGSKEHTKAVIVCLDFMRSS